METDFAVSEEMLREMVQVIIREVDPLRIVLFGSRAANTARPESDIDLLVIEETPFGGEGTAIGSGDYNGLATLTFKEKITTDLSVIQL